MTLSQCTHLGSGAFFLWTEEIQKKKKKEEKKWSSISLQLYLLNATTTGPQRLPSVPMPVWFRGLNVCARGQMDTFMSV